MSTEKNLWFNSNIVQEVIDALQKKPVLIYGAAGIGKTRSAYEVAKKLDASVVEFNSSDDRTKEKMQQFLSLVYSQPLVPTLYLLDEADGIQDWKVIAKALKETKTPIILTANDLKKIPDYIRKLCVVLRINKPNPTDTVNAVKANIGTMKVDFSKMKAGDVRAAIKTVKYGSQGYEDEDDITKITRLMKEGIVPENVKGLNLWLMDNFTEMLRGKDIVTAHELLEEADTWKVPEILSMLPRGISKPKFPQYLTKVVKSKTERTVKRFNK